jgi:tRNA nucleotidyltransferase (CCA-adding enzyme)
MRLNIPQNLNRIIEKLENAGFSAYLVGGCVRDFLLGKVPHDYDVATDALPEQTTDVLKDYTVIPTGIKHGTVSVIAGGKQYEITTFRREGAYSDRRRPDTVSFDATLADDLSRRDLTINALAYSPREGVIDLFGGIAHLNAKIITCVGKPDERFGEDALRILRAIRFASVLGFEIEEETKQSIIKNAPALQSISAERIRDELLSLISGENCKKQLIEFQNVFEYVLPAIEIYGKTHTPSLPADVWQYTAEVVENCPNDKTLRLAALLCNAALFYPKPDGREDTARQVMNGLKFDNKTKAAVLPLVAYHNAKISAETPAVLRMFNIIEKDGFYNLLTLQTAMARTSSDHTRLTHLEKVKEVADEAGAKNLPYRISHLAVDGSILLAAGIPRGRKTGEILSDILENVISGRISNTKEDIMSYVRMKFINE